MNRREFINSTVACGAVALTPLCGAIELKGGLKMPVTVKKGKVAVVYFSKTGNTRFAAQEIAKLCGEAKVLERFQDGLDRGDSYFVNDIVVSETYYALLHHYQKTKEDAIAGLKAISADPAFSFSDGFKKAIALPLLHRASPGFVDRLLASDYEELRNECQL